MVVSGKITYRMNWPRWGLYTGREGGCRDLNQSQQITAALYEYG